MELGVILGLQGQDYENLIRVVKGLMGHTMGPENLNFSKC